MRSLPFFSSKKTILLHSLILFSICFSQAQKDSTLIQNPDDLPPHFYLNQYKGGYEYEIIPELKGFDNLSFGLSLAHTYFSRGRGLIDRKSIQVGVEYIPNGNIFAPKIKYWRSSFPLLIEGNIGASALYYLKKNNSSFALRPEIGLGFYFIQFNYGYTFFFKNDFENLSPHSFSLVYYYPIISKKDR